MASAANISKLRRFGLIASVFSHLVLAFALFLGQMVAIPRDPAIEIVGSLQADPNSRMSLESVLIVPKKIVIAEVEQEFEVDVSIDVAAGLFRMENAKSGGGPGMPQGAASTGFSSLVAGFQRNGLDLVIVFDCTSSMGEEIQAVKERLLDVSETLIGKLPNTRIGLVVYRDIADRIPIEKISLGNDLRALQYFLEKIEAEGGGTDIREDLRIGLHHATKNMMFRDEAHKVILLFGDAPPRRFGACVRFAKDFCGRLDGRISAITCGSDREIYEFRHLAQITNGESMVLHPNVDIVNELVLLTFGERYRQEANNYLGFP